MALLGLDSKTSVCRQLEPCCEVVKSIDPEGLQKVRLERSQTLRSKLMDQVAPLMYIWEGLASGFNFERGLLSPPGMSVPLKPHVSLGCGS